MELRRRKCGWCSMVRTGWKCDAFELVRDRCHVLIKRKSKHVRRISFLMRTERKTNSVRIDFIHLHLTEGVPHFIVLRLFHKIYYCSSERRFISFIPPSPLLFSASLLLSLNSAGIHTQKSILLGLFAFGREHRHI